MSLSKFILFLSILSLSTYFSHAQSNKIEHVGIVGDNLLCIEVVDGEADQALKGFGKITNATFNAGVITDVSAYRITSTGDEDYKDGKSPSKVGYRSSGKEFVKAGDWSFLPVKNYWIYLTLPTSLKEGSEYTITLNNKVSGCGNINKNFKMQSKSHRSESIQVSQMGYLPGLPKYAFLSNWGGTAGPVDFSYLLNTKFNLLDLNSNVLFSGAIKLRRKSNEKGDDAYGNNFQKTDLYEMDFSGFNKEGKYRLSIPGLGCSYSFEIGKAAYKNAYTVTTKGLYYQRCGSELKEEHAGKVWKRIRCHHPADGKDVIETTLKLSDTQMGMQGKKVDQFTELPKRVTGKKLDYWGGWHDAGDWDRRIQHLNNAAQLIDVYYLFNTAFADKDLNIPESGNGIPDIMDEVIWCIDFYLRGQKENGGVRGGIESEGHPRFNTLSWNDPLHLYAYEEDYYASSIFAWCVAKAASALSLNPKSESKAKEYIVAAEKAWEWMEKNHDPKFRDLKNAAAAALYAATEKVKYHQAFKDTSIWTTTPNAAIKQYNKYDQQAGAIAYAIYLSSNKADVTLLGHVKTAIKNQGNTWVKSANKRGYRFAANMWRPMNWGLTSVPNVDILIAAYGISKEKKYADAIATSCSFTTGANPLNLVWVTGLGESHVTQILHIDSWDMAKRNNLNTVVPGLVPSGTMAFRSKSRGIHGFSQNSLYPDASKWPSIYSYAGNRFDPGMNEHTPNTIGPAAQAYAFMYAIGKTALCDVEK